LRVTQYFFVDVREHLIADRLQTVRNVGQELDRSAVRLDYSAAMQKPKRSDASIALKNSHQSREKVRLKPTGRDHHNWAIDPVARLTQRFEGCHILAQVMRLYAMRPIASRIAASSEHSGSLHAIGYAYEPLRLTLCESGPVANFTFHSTAAVIFGTGPVHQTFCAAWPGLGAS